MATHSCAAVAEQNKQQVAAAVNAVASSSAPNVVSSRLQHFSADINSHHQNHQQQQHSQSAKSFRGHQRRQSVARLLPDISKLRLLSWLVEASSELINCDIAIMDGVYAKLNKSQESLLFWNSSSTTTTGSASVATGATSLGSNSNQLSFKKQQQRPALPKAQPVAAKDSNIVISQRRKVNKSLTNSSASRNHHSLPLTNYDASSLAAVSLLSSSSLGPSRSADSDFLVCSNARVTKQQQHVAASSADTAPQQQVASSSSTCDQQQQLQQQDSCDSNEQSDDDDNSSAASSTTSSGIHNTSLSSSTSTASCSSSASSSCGSASLISNQLLLQNRRQQQQIANNTVTSANINSRSQTAEQLSEKIRRTVMKHNYLQSLLVNIIRRHDRQRDLLNQQRRRQMSVDQCYVSTTNSLNNHQQRYNNHNHHQQQRIDLADIADALDDGCLCSCHLQQSHRERVARTYLVQSDPKLSPPIRSSTLPTSATTNTAAAAATAHPNSNSSNQAPPARKVRRLKKLRSGSSNNNNNELNREDIIQLLADKLCENCYETHYWLYGCSSELLLHQQQHQPLSKPLIRQDSSSSTPSALSSSSSAATTATNTNIETIDISETTPTTTSATTTSNLQDLNGIIARRNATFIKLVQQEVRSTISKSIELIDLIRKEIKSPESIKQKQLMRCFSSSIQLLTSVGNYVVPTQDISTFIPEAIGQQQATLFSLPSSDFDHLLFYQQPSLASASQIHNPNANYHLASVPDLPIRRYASHLGSSLPSNHYQGGARAAGLPERGNSIPGTGVNQRQEIDSSKMAELALSSDLQRLKTSDNNSLLSNNPADSSSGASSNNSSASSSIARGGVQQSSLTRAAQTTTSSGANNLQLDGKTTSHHQDLSFEVIANLSRQQTEADDNLFNQRPKFWQSSKFNFIKKLLHVKQQRLLRQQSKDRRIYNNKVQNKFRLVMMDLTHFNKSQQLLTTENGVNSLLTSMRNVLEFGLYLTLKLY